MRVARSARGCTLTAMRAVVLACALGVQACTIRSERPPQVATASAEPVSVPAPTPEPASAPPSASAPPPSPNPSPARPSADQRAIADAMRRAIEAADREGWVPKRTVQIPGRAAVVVIYDPKPESAPAHKSARADAVGASGAPYTLQSGTIDVMKSPEKAVLWKLTGDSARFLVLHHTRCEPHCGAGTPVVLELDDRDAFTRAASVPECPTCMKDVDRDGVPEFFYRMVELRVAPCSRVSCGPETALLIQVQGYESWDGSRFARNSKSFLPLYAARLKAARAEVKRVKRAKNKKSTCPLDAMRVAAELFTYGRLTGVGELAAFKEADAVMAGYSTLPCSKEFDLLATPRSWIELRSELVSEKLPVLDAERAR